MPTRLVTLFRGRRWAGVVLVAIAAVAGGVALATALQRTPQPEAAPLPTTATATVAATPTPTATATPTPVRHWGILDGVPMSDAEWQVRNRLSPIAVMIDNHPDAVPQAGLDRADLVYEAFVEGGITRLMAVFWRQDAETVMPVRSARTPFVIWASELGALYGHAGSASTSNAADAAGQIYAWKVRDMDAFVDGSDGAYYRSNDRYAPHNLVTGTLALREAAASLGSDGPPAVESWPFKEDGEGAASRERAGGIEVNFQSRRLANGLVQWHWDPDSGRYLRFQSGSPHVDQVTKQQLAFKTVVVMRVPYEAIDASGHVVLDQYGEGPATIFLDGRKVEATWRKRDRLARTRFFDSTGTEVAFNRGPVFIEVVGPLSLVTTAAEPSGLPPMPRYEPPAPPPFVPAPRAPDPVTPAPSPSPTATGSATPRAGGTASATSPATMSPSPTATATASPDGTATPPATPGGTSTAPPTATASRPPDTSTAGPAGTQPPSAMGFE